MMEIFRKTNSFFRVIKYYKNWSSYCMDSLSLAKRKRMILKLRNGLKFYVRPKTSDKLILNEIFLDRLYLPNRDFLIEEGGIIIDIGAHIGIFSLFASRKAEAVYAFEPMPFNYPLLKYNIQINHAKNIVPYNHAVLDKEGESDIIVCGQGNTGGNTFFSNVNKGYGKVDKVRIKIKSFNQITKELGLKKIDFLKLDCEGSEFDILFNYDETVLNKINRIAMEYHNIDSKRNGIKMLDFLSKKGFSLMTYPKDILNVDIGMIYAIRR